MYRIYPSLFKLCPKESLVCDTCELAKHTRGTYPSKGLRCHKPFEVIHYDVWGPCEVQSIFGHRWFVIFIDDSSRYTWLYLLKRKSDVFSVFKDLCTLIQNQFGATIKTLRSDNGTEYINMEFEQFLVSLGIEHQTTCVNTPEQNGVAERKNRHLLEVTRSLMFTMNVPKFLWGEAVKTATYLINRMPLRTLGFKTPAECLLNSNDFVVPPKVFGCVCFVHDYRNSVGKLDPHAVKCVFMGYSSSQKGYRCWCPSEHRFFISMDVTFRKHEPYYLGSLNDTRIDLNPPAVGQEGENTSGGSVIHPILVPTPGVSSFDNNISRQGEEVHHDNPDNSSHGDMQDASQNSLSSPTQVVQPTMHDDTDSISIPKNWKVFPMWREAMLEEMRALEKNKTWELVDLPLGKQPVGCKWVFTIKHTPEGKVKRYKARLVAKGYIQTYGIDYEETFAPVAKKNSIRTLISCAANLNWLIYQMDVKNAFLHGDLHEEVYMHIPPGFETSRTTGKVLRLRRSLYGLKQSPSLV
ncbi:hypothetical protein U9M48_017993 [Paspalum notatum var. saurae]|uniref:Integrase catalytic domain-containing protein n=1 Tax=Paspalum notatum var. saurae TaxID=547442 RepID=A0AAQ3T957_PASNO